MSLLRALRPAWPMDDLEGKLTGRPSLSACTENLPIQPITRFGLLLVSKKKKIWLAACILARVKQQFPLKKRKKKRKGSNSYPHRRQQADSQRHRPPGTGSTVSAPLRPASARLRSQPPRQARQVLVAQCGGPPRRPLELVERLARAAVQLLG